MHARLKSNNLPAIDIVEHALHLAGNAEEEEAILIAETEAWLVCMYVCMYVVDPNLCMKL